MKGILFVLTFIGLLSIETNAQAVIVRKRELNAGSGTNPSVGYSISTPTSNMGTMFYSRYHHAIKISPAALIAGDIPISYEHKISDYLTIEAGLGITTYNLTEDLIHGYSTRSNGETVSKVSYSSLFNTKFFPEGNSFQDGYYIAFNLNLRNFTQNFVTQNSFGIDTTIKESFRWADVGFTTGLHSRPSEKMILDWYIGAGIRQKNRLTSDLFFDPNSGIHQYIRDEKISVVPALLGGVKISLLFR